MSNTHVRHVVKQHGDELAVQFTYKDHFEVRRVFKHSFSLSQIRADAARHGVPRSIFQPYFENERSKRNQTAANGLFRFHNNSIRIDHRSVIMAYAHTYCRPIAEHISSVLGSEGRDTRENRIAMAMAFVQDIPYGVPNFDDENWYFGGLIPPPLLIVCGFGDCDSKSVLFCGIMSFLIDCEDLSLFSPPSHVLTGIRHVPGPGMTYITYKGSQYVICETAGPGRTAFGEKRSYYHSLYEVIPLNLHRSEIGPMIPMSAPVRASTTTRRPEWLTSAQVEHRSTSTTERRGSSSSTPQSTSSTRHISSSGSAQRRTSSDAGHTSGSHNPAATSTNSTVGSYWSRTTPREMNERVIVWLGAGSGWWIGTMENNSIQLRGDAQHWVATGTLGIRLSDEYEDVRSSMLLCSVTYGEKSPRLLNGDQTADVSGVPSYELVHELYEAEAGFSLWECIMLQAGAGRRIARLQMGGRTYSEHRAEYLLVSTGLSLRYGMFDAHIVAKAMYEQRIARPSYRLQGSLAMRLELF